MFKKICLFKQDSGIGDCCFLQKAAQHFSDLGYEVIWPILPQLMFLKDYLITPAKFVSTEESLSVSPDLVIDFQTADRYFYGNTLLAKYKLIDLNCNDWSKFLKIKRNKEKESSLFKDFLGLSDIDKYNLINKNYGTPPNYKSFDRVQAPNNGLTNIYMSILPNFHLFDWLKVLEKASNIYSIDTSFLFLIETMQIRAEEGEVIIWPREGHYTNIDGLFTKKYKKIN